MGLVTSVYHLAMAQAALGHSVDVLSIRNKPAEPAEELAENFVNYTYAMRRNRFFLDDALVSDLRCWSEEIDIVHFHSAYHPEYFSIARILKELSIPYVISPRGSYQRYANRKGFWRKKIYKMVFEQSLLREAAAIHVLNAAEQREALAYGVPQEKLFVVTNGVDFSIVPPRYTVPQETTAAAADLTIVYCGRIDPVAKGLDVLVAAVAETSKMPSDLNIQLLIMGPDWQGGLAKLNTMISNLDVKDRVHYLQARYEMAKFKVLATADLFVLLSRSEGMPTGVLEAMAFAMPCLLSRETNIDASAEEAGACVFIEHDVQSIAQLLCELAVDKARLTAMGAKAQHYAHSHYDYREIALSMQQQYLDATASDARLRQST